METEAHIKSSSVQTLTELSSYRLVSQQFSGSRFKKPSELLSWSGPFQGQEYALTKWSFALRIPGLDESVFEEEFNNGSILRTHLMRATWHFVHTEDIRWILQLTSPRIDAINSFMYRKLELDDAVFRKSAEILRNSLAGRQLTRSEISDILEKNKIAASGMRLGYILMKAEIDGVICSGGRQGKHFTYALTDDRSPLSSTKDPEEALALLTKKYFRARGPATINDFAIWSGLSVSMCKRGTQSVRNELEHVTLNAREYFYSGSNDGIIPEGPFLLPVYDEFVMGYKDRTAMFEVLNHINRSDLFFNNMIVHRGQVVGTWKRTAVKNRMGFEFRLLTKLSRVTKQKIKAEAKRFARFYGYQAQINNI